MGHNCTDVLSKVYLALDGELSGEEEKQFLEDLKACNYCLERFHIEKSFKQFLSERISKKCCTDGLVDKIRTRLNQPPTS